MGRDNGAVHARRKTTSVINTLLIECIQQAVYSIGIDHNVTRYTNIQRLHQCPELYFNTAQIKIRARAQNWIRANCNLIEILWTAVLGPTSALAMAFTGIVCFLFICVLSSGRATSCTSGNDCSWGESCCEEGVCREICSVYYCSYDYQCSNGEQCCDGICSLWCANFSPSPTPRMGWSQSQVMGLIITLIFSASVISCFCCCCCCAYCPYHRHSSSRRQIAPQSSTPRQAYVVFSVRTTAISSVTAHRT